MKINSEQHRNQTSWTRVEPHIDEERIANAIKRLDSRFFITPWLHHIQELINKQH